MSLHCKICEERIKIKKSRSFFEPRYNSTKYCSFRCQFANLRILMLSIGIFLVIVYVSISIPLYNMDSDLWFLFVIMIPLLFLAICLIIGGVVSTTIYTSIRRRINQKKYYCYFCGYDITQSSMEGSLLCNSCGNKVLYCSLCSKIINPGEQITMIKPCNHVFHKAELLDFAEEESFCPKCKGKIVELSFDLKKEKEVFWEKAK